jgi:DNA-binding transcriptional ArsR family regulator
VTVQLDLTFRALADPTRRAILAQLAGGEVSVTALTARSDLTQPAISKHLKVLERAGLVSRRQDAQRRLCRLQAEPLLTATRWLSDYRQFWATSFDHLDALLNDVQKGAGTDDR